MRLALIHCHGSGNDFPLIDARGLAVAASAWPAIARALADRAGPVGGDGLLLLGEGDATSAFAMTMFNSDGSEAETCLNGLRCVARLAFEQLGIHRAIVRLKQSRASVERAPDLAPGVYAVSETVGPASLALADWPLDAGPGFSGEQLIDAALPPLGSERAFTAVAMPNPHLVAFVNRIDEAELVAIGERCEAAPAWLPNRANVSFVERRGADALFVRTFERGVGLTDSCGSAMAAATYAACLTGRAAWDVPLIVFNKGGRVGATARKDASVTLVGNATWQWAGHVEWDADTGRLGGLVVERRFEDEVAAWAKVVPEG